VIGARGLEAELREDASDVAFDGLAVQHKPLGNALVREPLRHEPENLALAGGQLVER
jgi:hypothetical protein